MGNYHGGRRKRRGKKREKGELYCAGGKLIQKGLIFIGSKERGPHIAVFYKKRGGKEWGSGGKRVEQRKIKRERRQLGKMAM